MPVLVAGIDARGARRGAQTFSQASNQIKRDAGGVAVSIDRTDKGLVRLSQGFLAFSAVGFAVGVGLAATALIRSADAMTLVESRLKLVTESTTELSRVQSELFDIAQDTRTGFIDLVDVYGRFARTTRDLNLADGELLENTELLSKLITISGATATEASSAFIQLSQGFAAGALRGDEFRSVSEQIPAVLGAVADGLGITRGELRKLAFEGQLTAERFFEGLSNSAATIRSDFEEIPVTVGQAFTRLGNSVVRVVGDLDDVTGATSGLASAITALSDALDGLETQQVSAVGRAEERLATFIRRQEESNGLADVGRRLAEDIIDPRAREEFLQSIDREAQLRRELLDIIETARRQRDLEIRSQGPSPIFDPLSREPARRSDIPDEDFAKILDRNARADAKAAKEIADSRRRSAEVQAGADERVRQARFDLLEATQDLRDEEKSLADQIIDRNLTAQEQYNQSLRELEDIRHRLTDDQFSREFKRIGDELREADPLFQSIVSRAEQFGTAISSAMAQAVTGTQSWNAALQQVGNSILQIAINIAIEESIKKIFSAVATSLTTDTAAVGSTGAPSPGPGVNPGTGQNVISNAARTANTPIAAASPSFNVSIQNSGAPAQVDSVNVLSADRDRVDLEIILAEVGKSAEDGGTVGQSFERAFGLQRTPKQV